MDAQQHHRLGSDANNIWAVGNTGTILKYNGSSWAAEVADVSVANYAIRGVGTQGFIAANSGTVFTKTLSPAVVLPVELLSFSGKNTESGNLLTWTTASEVYNKGFQVERAPQPPKGAFETWETLGFVAPKSPKGTLHTYDFLDVVPPSGAGAAYYRLRQIDNDGKETLSKVVSVQNSPSGGRGLKVYPNPVSNVLTVEFGSPLWGLGADVFQILNLLGQSVLSGKTAQRIDVSALPQGAYFLKVGAEQMKFVKQ